MSQDKPSDAKSSPAKLTGAAAEPITGTSAQAKPATERQAVGKDADTKPTDKRPGNINTGATPATVSEPLPLSAGNRKESAIKQPVDALRRSPASQDATNKNQTSTGTATKTAAQIETDTATDTETNTATGIKTTPPADTTGKAGAMNSNSDKKTDNKAGTGASASSGVNKGSGSGAIAGGTASSAESKPGTNTSPNPSTNPSTNTGTKSSPGKQPPTSTVPNSGNKSNEPYKANAANKANKANGVWTGLILGLVLVAVALGIGLWWQQQRFESVAKEVATRLQQSDQQASQASERASQALTLATAQREVVDQLRRELSVANNDLAALQQAWESANEGLDQTLLLNDLKRLITMANQELVLFGNVNSAVSILSSVDTMLQTQSAPALKNLQQAVIQDLARLRSVPQVDVASLSARLDSLILLTNKAPLLAPAGANNLQGSGDQAASGSTTGGAAAGTSQSTSPSSPSTDGGTGNTAWWASWDTATGQVSQWSSEASEVLMREFANVLSIRKADDPQALLLSEEQAMQLKANVRAMLLSAQLALMTRQAEIWRSELTEVQSLLNTRYDTDALDTKASLQLLGELLQAPLAADVPQIAQTLNALASAERVVTIPAADRAGTDQQSTGESTDGSATESATESTTESTTELTTEPTEQTTTAPAATENAAKDAIQGAATEATGAAADTASTTDAPSLPSTPSTPSTNSEQGS